MLCSFRVKAAQIVNLLKNNRLHMPKVPLFGTFKNTENRYQVSFFFVTSIPDAYREGV